MRKHVALLRPWICIQVFAVLLLAMTFMPQTVAQASSIANGPGLGLKYGQPKQEANRSWFRAPRG
jgi:Na+/pantothenate symporter